MSLQGAMTAVAVSTIIGGIMGAGGSIAAYIDAFNKIPGHEQISRQEFLRGLVLSALQGFSYGMIGGLIFGVGLVILIAGGASAPALLKAMGCLSATGVVQSAFMYFQNMQQGNTCSAMYNCITFALSAVGAVKCFEYAGQVNAANAAKAAAEKAKSGKTVAAKETSGTTTKFGDNDLVLGLNENGSLKSYANKNGGKTYGDFNIKVDDFRVEIKTAMSRSDTIRFNLDNFNLDVGNSYSPPKVMNYGQPTDNYTNYEFWLIKTNPEYLSKTVFYLNGEPVPASQVIY